MDAEVPQEDRMLAALAHASVFASGIGFLAGILIYVTQKEKSSWLAGQALQAAVYQLAGLLLIIAAWTLWGICYTLSLIPLMANAEQYADAPPPIFWVGLASTICPFLVMVVFWLYGLLGAIRAWTGADFRYLVVGNLVNKRLAAQNGE